METNNQSISSPAGQYTEDCLADLKARNYSPVTIEHYRNEMQHFDRFLVSQGITRLQDVTIDDLDAYRLSMAKAGFTTNSIRDYLKTARILFGYLEKNQLLFINPAANLIIPQEERKIGYIPTEDEVKKLLNTPDISTPKGARDRALLECAYSCGLRTGELVKLDIFDPDLQKKSLRVQGKGRKERVVPLGKQAVFWLKTYIKQARVEFTKDSHQKALWLTSQFGKRLNNSGMQAMVHKYAIAAGLEKISIHALRRACVTHMLAGGANPVDIQTLLGHANLRNLRRYLKITISEMHKMHQRSKPGK